MTDETDIERLDYSKPPQGYFLDHDTPRSWRHYKAENDPPGMTVESFRARVLDLPDPEARAAAWTWHDRRRVLADRLSVAVVVSTDRLYGGLNVGLPSTRKPLVAWPRCLSWTDEEVGEVERWLSNDGAEMPKALRDIPR